MSGIRLRVISPERGDQLPSEPPVGAGNFGANMSISGISSAINLTSLLGKVLRGGESSKSDEASSQSEASPAASANVPAALPELAALLPPEGFRSITPQQFAEVAQRLHDRGLISDSEFNDLAAIRLDLDLQGTSADQPLDVISFLKDRLAQLQSQFDSPDGGTQFSLGQVLDSARRRLDFVQQLQAGGQQGLDAVA